MLVFGFGNSVFADSANITQINFTSSSQNINANTLSAIISIQTQNVSGTAEQIGETNHLDLTSTSATGEFFDANSTICTDALITPFSLTMRSNSANKNFCYKDSTPGTYTLTVSAQEQTWTSATQDIVIVGSPITLSSITITTPATKLIYIVGDTLDISDLVVTGTYSDSSSQVETITSGNITGFDSATPATGQILTITVGDKTTTYTVDINANTSAGGNGNSTHLDIKTDVDVPANCGATDIDGLEHNYPQGDSYLAICALAEALKNGTISNVKLSNQFPSMGLFITSINGINADPSSQYWAIYQNGNYANSGITSLPVVAGDVIMIQLHDFSDNYLGDQVIININSLVEDTPTQRGNSGSRNTSYTPPSFDVQKALTYLKNAQGADGSFGSSLLYTDWAGIAFGAMNVSDTTKDKLLAYFNSHNTLSSLLTDNERHAMALLALGQNPYAFGGVNYIKAITDSFDGTQFGDANLINDDIFALIPLKNSGYTATDEMIKKDVAFLISKQKTDGSWEESVDITSATIQALKPFESIAGVTESISKSTNYLISKQNNDGGFGENASSIYSTSWVMQAMGALSASWIKDGHAPMDYLATKQMTDGAILSTSETLQNRIWATSYAIVGSTIKPWSVIMQTVSKPTESLAQNNLNANTLNPVKKTTLIPKIKKIALASQDLQTDANKQVTPDTLTAAAINTENATIKNNAIPFILGFLSGIIVLYLFYLLRKFLVK